MNQHSEFMIDAHLHVWDPATGLYGWLDREPPVIQRAFCMDDARDHLESCGVRGAVLVQAADHDADTDRMLDLYDTDPLVWGVVGYIPLEQPDQAAERLTELRRREGLVGIRNLIHDQPDPDWILREDVADGLGILQNSGLPFDLVSVLPRHLEHADYLANRFPDLTIVIDHLSKPPIKSPGREPWHSLLRRAAANPKTVAKLSGLYPVHGDPADFTANDLKPFIDIALELFGPDRLMIGSDWPIAVVAGGYERVVSTLQDVITSYGDDVARPILSGTVSRVYKLPENRTVKS